MKKLFLALLAVASIGTANAQKNTFLMFGNAGVNYGKTDNGPAGTDKTTSWNVTPGFGFQFNNHLTVGVEGTYNEFKDDMTMIAGPVTTNTINRSREWQVGAFFRYTQPLGGIFSMYTQLDATYINGLVENTTTVSPLGPNTSVSDDYNGFQAMISPWISINVHKGMALNFNFGGVGYRMTSFDVAPTTMSDFFANFGQVFNIGVSRNIGCHCGHHRGHHDPGMEHRKMKKHDADDDDE